LASAKSDHDREAIPASRETTCAQVVDMVTWKVRSEIYTLYEFESEVANDCFVDRPGTITEVMWWGGPIDGPPSDPEVTTFNLRFYTDHECLPGELIAELLEVSPAINYVGDDPNGFPTYIYVLETDVHLDEGPFWFSAQGINEGARKERYPPKHGRAGDGVDKAAENRSCETAFRSPNLGFPHWVPVIEYLGEYWTASQQFEFDPDPSETDVVNWGSLKAHYQ